MGERMYYKKSIFKLILGFLVFCPLLLSLSSCIKPANDTLFLTSDPHSTTTKEEPFEIKLFGAIGDGISHPITQEDIDKNTQWKNTYSVGDEWDTVALQEAIDNSNVVEIPKGRYIIYRKKLDLGKVYIPTTKTVAKNFNNINLKSNLTIKGQDGAVLVGQDTLKPIQIYQSHINSDYPLENVTIDSVGFENIDIRFDTKSLYVQEGTTDILTSAIKNIKLTNCIFSDGGVKHTNEPSTMNYFVTLLRVKDFIIDDCKFFRKNEDDLSRSRGIGIGSSHNITIKNSVFEGYFITAINNGGSNNVILEDNSSSESFLKSAVFDLDKRSHNILIDNNRIIREKGFSINNDGEFSVVTPNYAEDHGIYVWGMDGITISNNYIKGWSPTAYGGAIKARNGENVKIFGNTLEDSGILLYAYETYKMEYEKNENGDEICTLREQADPSMPCTDSDLICATPNTLYAPPYFRNVEISGNIISNNIDLKYEINGGISYWRSYDFWMDPIEHDKTTGEYDKTTEYESITIKNNTVNNGGIKIYASSPMFIVEDNKADKCIYWDKVINTEYNSKRKNNTCNELVTLKNSSLWGVSFCNFLINY